MPELSRQQLADDVIFFGKRCQGEEVQCDGKTHSRFFDGEVPWGWAVMLKAEVRQTLISPLVFRVHTDRRTPRTSNTFFRNVKIVNRKIVE